MADETNTSPEMDVTAGSNVDAGAGGQVEMTDTPSSSWQDRIPEQYREAGYWKNVKDETDLYTQFAELQKYRGSSFKVPPPDATQDDWNSVYSKLGRPDTADAYDVVLRDHDGAIEWNETADGWLKGVSHELGLNNKQAQHLIDRYGELMIGQHSETVQAQRAQLEQLKETYGDLYERKVTLGERAMQKIGGDELVDMMTTNGWNTNPAVVKAMIKLGSLFEEQNFIDGSVGGMGSGEAKAKLDAIFGDMSHPYWNGQHPDHDRAVREYDTLNDIVYNSGRR